MVPFKGGDGSQTVNFGLGNLVEFESADTGFDECFELLLDGENNPAAGGDSLDFARFLAADQGENL